MADAIDRARRLVGRYLDPSARWSSADERALRDVVRADPAAASLYDRLVARHRALLGVPVATPSGLELRRMREVTVEAAAGSGRDATGAGWRRWALGLGAVVVAAAVALVAIRAGSPRDPDDVIAARGIEGWPEPVVGLGIGAVTPDGTEVEAIASRAIGTDDWLRMTYTNERADLGWLFVVAVQPERPAGERVVWIAPRPDEPQSLAIGVARFRELPFEVRVATRHAPGPVAYVAVFTRGPVTVDAMRAALDADPSRLVPSAIEALLRERLALSPDDVVEVLPTRIVPGTAADDGGTPREEGPGP